MDVLVVSSSPNTDGLTAACARAAIEAIRAVGHQAEEMRLNDHNIACCQACNNGWGTCREERRCTQDDEFPELHRRFVSAEAYVLVTPVYFGEPSESMKAFADRIRRCERAIALSPGGLEGKPVLVVAAAGGSGNGTVQCLDCLERWCRHVGARRLNFIGVTRFTRGYKLGHIGEAAAAMVSRA